MQLDGRVADKAPTRDDREMVAEAERARAPSEDAIEEMRRRGRGWMHVRWVQGKAVVVLAEGLGGDRPRVTWYCEGGCESARHTPICSTSSHRGRRKGVARAPARSRRRRRE